MNDLDHTFVIRDKIIHSRMIAFVANNWERMASDGKCMVAHLMTESGQRSVHQNKLYWKLMTDIAESCWLGGKQFSKSAWAEFFRREFLPMMEGPHGDYPVSTTSLSVKEMSEYLERIHSYAASTLGLEI